MKWSVNSNCFNLIVTVSRVEDSLAFVFGFTMRKCIDANRFNSVLTSGTLENRKPFPIQIETISEKCKQITHHR